MQKKQLDPYEVLGVKRDADPETIKAAYRRQAKAHHPDTGGDKDRFAEATLAYDVLMDEKRRKLFDEQGKIDDSPIGAKQGQARQVLYEMLAHALMGEVDPCSINLLAQIEQSLLKQIEELDAQAARLDRAMARADVMEKRFVRKSKKEKENVFVDFLKNHKLQIAHAKGQNADIREVKTIAIDIAREYKFSQTAMNNWSIRYYGSPGTGGATSIIV